MARKVKLGGKDCEHEGGRICNGAVTEELGEYLRTCTNGRIIRRRASKVGKGYALVGRDTGRGKGRNTILRGRGWITRFQSHTVWRYCYSFLRRLSPNKLGLSCAKLRLN